MPKIPSNPPSSFQPGFEQYNTSPNTISLSRNCGNFLKKNQFASDENSFKKRLQIFKQYELKPNLASENDDTIVYNKRRRDCERDQKDILPTSQRQFQSTKKLNRQELSINKGWTGSIRRHHIFNTCKPFLFPKQRLSIKSVSQNQGEAVMITERFNKNGQNLQQRDLQWPVNFQATTGNNIYNDFSKGCPRVSSVEKFKISDQYQSNLTSPNKQKIEFKAIQQNAPNKFTFTYHDPVFCQGKKSLEVTRAINFNIFGSQSSQALINMQPNATNLQFRRNGSSETNPMLLLKQQKTRFRNQNWQKRPFDLGEKSWDCIIQRDNTLRQPSWGKKIRTGLMGVRSQQKVLKTKDFGSSKVSIKRLKQSFIINGEKIAKDNLKINESMSNISDKQSSKRYYDQDIDNLLQIKKVSYKNIDLSRDLSREQSELNNEDFNQMQLLLELQSQKYQTKSSEKVQNSPADKSQVKTPKEKELIQQKEITKELLQQIKFEEVNQKKNKGGNFFPAVLIVLAILLLAIQTFV